MRADDRKPVFICHSSQDAEVARQICAYLEKGQIGCWIAPRDVDPGADYAEEIIDAIEQAAVMLLVLSAGSNQSRHVKNEVERAVSKGKIILPLRIENVLPRGALELHVASCQWVDAYVPPLEPSLSRLADAIQVILGKNGPTTFCRARDGLERWSDPKEQGLPSPIRGGAEACGSATTIGIVTGNGVNLRQKPTVAAKVIQTLARGQEVLVVGQITPKNDGECQLKEDLIFKPETGAAYRLRAGRGLLISGERGDAYRIEIRRSRSIDVGYISKNAVDLLVSALWYKVRIGKIEGWVYSRYIRTF